MRRENEAVPLAIGRGIFGPVDRRVDLLDDPDEHLPVDTFDERIAMERERGDDNRTG